MEALSLVAMPAPCCLRNTNCVTRTQELVFGTHVFASLEVRPQVGSRADSSLSLHAPRYNVCLSVCLRSPIFEIILQRTAQLAWLSAHWVGVLFQCFHTVPLKPQTVYVCMW